jgi:hypothetical protein
MPSVILNLWQWVMMLFTSAKDPTVSINCWILGEDLQRVISITVSRESQVAALKVTIKNERPGYANTPADSFDLWAVHIPDEDLDSKLHGLRSIRKNPLPKNKLIGVGLLVIAIITHNYDNADKFMWKTS